MDLEETVDGNEPNMNPDESSRLTDWENEPSLSVFTNDHMEAKSGHDTMIGNLDRWNDLRNVEGAAKPKKIQGRSSVQPKLIRRQAEWRYPALSEPFLSSNKMFTVKPVTFEDKPKAEQNELVLNWQFRTKINKTKFIDDYVRGCVDEGTVFVKVGWTRHTEEESVEVPVYEYFAITSQEDLDQLEQAGRLKIDDPTTYEETVPDDMKAAIDYFEETGQPVVAIETGETETVVTEKVIENRPDLSILNPKNVIIDPTCEGDLDKAKFGIISFETCKGDLHKEGIYKNLDKIAWESLPAPNEDDHYSGNSQEFQFRDATRRRVVAYEYWGYYDIHGTGELKPIVATWIGQTLIRLSENPYPDGKIPLVVATYLPVKRMVHGEPDAELLEDNQAVLGALMRGMIDLLGRSANAQQGFAKGALDPLNRMKFERGEDYEFNPQQNIRDAHIQHKFPELPRSAIEMAGIQNQEAEALTGVKSFSGGISGESYGDVAAGIRGVLDAASKRELAILRRLAKGLIDIGNKIIAMNAEFLSEEETIRVTNEQFIQIRREDLKGNFDLQTDISTAEVDQQRAQDMAFMLQTMGPDMDLGLKKILLADIANLKRMPALAEEIRNYEPQPDPIQQELAQLEITKIKAEIAKIESEIIENQADAARKQAEANSTTLDAVEQETGVTHLRGLEQTKAQARGNQDLQVTKALTQRPKENEGEPDIEGAVGFNAVTDLRDNAQNLR